MPTPKKGPRLGGSPAHQRLILSNLATALFEHGRITTTETRARTLRPVAEKLITKAKKAELGTVESLHHRREVLKTIRDKSVVHTLFTEIGPSFAERPGGYTRITKIGPRKGDNAPMAVIELVTEKYDPKPARTKAKKTEEPKQAAPVAEDEVEETDGRGRRGRGRRARRAARSSPRTPTRRRGPTPRPTPRRRRGPAPAGQRSFRGRRAGRRGPGCAARRRGVRRRATASRSSAFTGVGQAVQAALEDDLAGRGGRPRCRRRRGSGSARWSRPVAAGPSAAAAAGRHAAPRPARR